MKSKFGTTKCHKCGNLIAVGAEISKEEDCGWHHTTCPGEVPDTPSPPNQQTLSTTAGENTPVVPSPDPLVATQAFIDLMAHNKIIDAEKWSACSRVFNTERMQS